MDVYILLDRSGSMSTLWNEAIGSINGYVEKLDPEDKVHFAVFDSVSHDLVQAARVKDWKKVDEKSIDPRGGTPLYDSCGEIMTLAETMNSEKTFLVVMTDGYENASHEHNQASIKAKVKAWEERNWEVVFLGANFDDVTSVSNSVGVMAGKTMNYTTGNFMRGMDTLAVSTMAYATAGTAINFSEEQKQAVNTK